MNKWLNYVKRIQAISQAGIAFSKDVYDLERYEELRKLSHEMMSDITENPINKINDFFMDEKGYPTPKLDVRGVVFKNDKVLLVKEKSDQKWALPGGYCEVGISLSQNVVKEIQEESGYIVEPKRLLAVLDMNHHPHPPQAFHMYKIFVECQIVGGHAAGGVETKEVDFFASKQLPPLSISRNTESQIHMMFEFREDPNKPALFE